MTDGDQTLWGLSLPEAMTLTGLSAVELEEMARRERVSRATQDGHAWSGPHIEHRARHISSEHLAAILSVLSGETVQQWRERTGRDTDEPREA